MNKKLGLLISIGLILSFGLTTIWSTVPNLFLAQIGFLFVGVIIAYLFYKADLSLLISLATPFYLFSIVLLLLTLFFGHASRGATRWLGIGIFAPQTSEIVKPLLAIAYASFLTDHKLDRFKDLFLYLLMAVIPVLLVIAQPDLGSAMVLLFLASFMGLFAGIGFRKVALLVVFFLLLVPLTPHLLKDYQLNRLESFINPYHDPQGKGYNVIQSVIAIGSGGLIGRGVRLGTQSHLNFLPERHTDFIFASFSEEFGFFGISLVMLAYFYLLSTYLSTSLRQKDTSYRLLNLGIFSIFAFQILVNLGMNLGLMPVTGITLPLFSYGGSSLLSFMVLLGISFKLLELTPLHQL